MPALGFAVRPINYPTANVIVNTRKITRTRSCSYGAIARSGSLNAFNIFARVFPSASQFKLQGIVGRPYAYRM